MLWEFFQPTAFFVPAHQGMVWGATCGLIGTDRKQLALLGEWSEFDLQLSVPTEQKTMDLYPYCEFSPNEY